jgi:predicted DNA-binding protein (UPF0278 family)
MFDYFKNAKVPQIDEIVAKSTDVAIQTIDYQNSVFKETLKFFNTVTDKFFYTYTVSAADAVNKGTEYAKEAITKAGKQLSTVSANSK